MNLSRIWPLLLGAGITLGLGTPIAKAAAHHGVGALAFALWPTLAAGLLLGTIGLLRQGRPADLPRLARFGGVAGLFGHALPMSAVFWLSAQAGAGFAWLATERGLARATHWGDPAFDALPAYVYSTNESLACTSGN